MVSSFSTQRQFHCAARNDVRFFDTEVDGFTYAEVFHNWYFGTDGPSNVIDTTPLGGGDDQLIYRFTMIVDGQIFDTDSLPGEMMITAAIEATSNCFSITNVRVKHRPDVTTPNPLP